MATESFHSVFEVLLRHGVPTKQAKLVAMNALRNFDPERVSRVFSRVERPDARYCPLQSPEEESAGQVTDLGKKFRSWWPGAYAPRTIWVSPPWTLMRQAVEEKAALCTNIKGEWDLKESGYVAISHVWIEGLQRNSLYDGVELWKVQRIFALLKRAKVNATWIWTDVIAVPSTSGSRISIEDDILKTDIINTLHLVYTNADSVVVLDALLLQLTSKAWLDAAILLVCGRWVSRVWTYQESKLPKEVVILTRNTHHRLQDMVSGLKRMETDNSRVYWALWRSHAVLLRDDDVCIRLGDIVKACQSRSTTNDVDYARAFFPLLDLTWEHGLTCEQGMQIIYQSRTEDASRLAPYFGAPLIKADLGGPCWLPSRLTGLEGRHRAPMSWEKRGVRGDWFVVGLTELQEFFTRRKRVALNFRTKGTPSGNVQCAILEAGQDELLRAIQDALARSTLHLLCAENPSEIGSEFMTTVLLVDRADSMDFEVTALCAALMTSKPDMQAERKSVYIRRGSPYINSDFENLLLYHDEQGYAEGIHLDGSSSKFDAMKAAIVQNDLPMVTALLDSGASPTAFDEEGWTPLHIAAVRGKDEVLRWLLDRSEIVDIESKNVYRHTPLHWAAKNGQTIALHTLAKYGADVNRNDHNGWAPIMVAALESHAETVKELIVLGVDPDYLGEFTWQGTPLMIAAGKPNSLETVKLLLACGASANGQSNPRNATPLHRAAEWGREDVLALLIAEGASIDKPEYQCLYTPLRYAIKGGFVGCVRRLLVAGANRNSVFENGWTPAHVAAQCKKWEILRMLVDGGELNVNVQTRPGSFSPLHLATQLGAEGTMHIRILLRVGADRELLDDHGCQPLSYAVASRCQANVDLLLSGEALNGNHCDG